MVYTAPKEEIERVKTLFLDMGILLPELQQFLLPFRIFFGQNGCRLAKKYLPVCYRNNFSRIDLYNKENLVMSRGH